MPAGTKTEAPDAARTSYYVTDAFYADLVEAFTDFDRTEREIRTPELRDECRALLEREARLLDQWRHDEWLALFAEECAYWIPGTPERGDPRREIAFAFHDRRQLEDRIYRLGSGYAWSQVPRSRTVRMVSNVEVFEGDAADMAMTRSNFLIAEFRDGDSRQIAGWNAHRLRRDGEGWVILAKQVNLLECDQNLRNPSITL